MIAAELASLLDFDFGWTALNVFRVAFVIACLLLVGANLSFVRHAPLLFTRESCMAWRMFFLGKSCITVAVAFAVWARIQSDSQIATWTILAGFGVMLSNIALGLLYHRREILLDHIETAAQTEHEEGEAHAV
jgi:hypothetical protein